MGDELLADDGSCDTYTDCDDAVRPDHATIAPTLISINRPQARSCYLKTASLPTDHDVKGAQAVPAAGRLLKSYAEPAQHPDKGSSKHRIAADDPAPGSIINALGNGDRRRSDIGEQFHDRQGSTARRWLLYSLEFEGPRAVFGALR